MNAPIMHKIVPTGEDYTKNLRDEIAKIAFTAMAAELGTNFNPHDTDVPAVATVAAKISFDFADAFMRERYERESVARCQPMNHHIRCGTSIVSVPVTKTDSNV